MARLGFRRGAPSSAVALLGGAGVTVAEPWTLPWFAAGAMAVVGLFVFVLGITIDGRPWWNRPRSLLKFRAVAPTWDYHVGSKVEGITWEEGMSHVTLWVTNATGAALTQLQLILSPDRPILHAVCRSNLGQCSIGLATAPPPSWIFADGKMISAEPSPDNIILGPPYRLFCPSLPVAGVIQIDMATVTPTWDVMSSEMWLKEPQPPAEIVVTGIVSEGDYTQQVERRIELRSRKV